MAFWSKRQHYTIRVRPSRAGRWRLRAVNTSTGEIEMLLSGRGFDTRAEAEKLARDIASARFSVQVDPFPTE